MTSNGARRDCPLRFAPPKERAAFHVVYCAEYDALPDVGHACGHNIIATSSLGAALGLGQVADELDLRVTLLGTPSEEGGGGKIDLLKAGYFDDEHMALMVHPFPTERLDAICLAVDQFDVTYSGKEAHASAAPWMGRNALDALTIAQVALGLLRQQLPPGDQVHGVVTRWGLCGQHHCQPHGRSFHGSFGHLRDASQCCANA